MTKAEEKANELIEMFIKVIPRYKTLIKGKPTNERNAIKCAILHCHELINVFDATDYYSHDPRDLSETKYDIIQFYTEVIEILKGK